MTKKFQCLFYAEITTSKEDLIFHSSERTTNRTAEQRLHDQNVEKIRVTRILVPIGIPVPRLTPGIRVGNLTVISLSLSLPLCTQSSPDQTIENQILLEFHNYCLREGSLNSNEAQFQARHAPGSPHGKAIAERATGKNSHESANVNR